MRTVTEIEKVIEVAKVVQSSAASELEDVKSQFRVEIEAINKKYAPEIDPLQSKLDKVQDDISSLHRELMQTIIDRDWADAKSRGEINEFYLMSMMKKEKIDTYDVDIKHKQMLKNGIDIWMIVGGGYSDYKFYMAFVKDELIGTSFRFTAKHAGDDTTPFSFIGELSTILKVKKDSYGFLRSVNANFQEWVRELKTLKEDNFILMPMTDEILERINKNMQLY